MSTQSDKPVSGSVSSQSRPQPLVCRTKYISGLTLESGELLKHYQELYDAEPFSEDTIEAGTNLNDHIKETRKQKWEETITGIDLTHNSKKGWQTLSKINGDDRKPISSPNITPDAIAHQLLLNGKPDQGSVLSPLLFNVYTNDQPLPVATNSFIYADDLCLTTQQKTFEQVETTLASGLNELDAYYNENHLRPNPAKTQVTAFHLKNHQADRKRNVTSSTQR